MLAAVLTAVCGLSAVADSVTLGIATDTQEYIYDYSGFSVSQDLTMGAAIKLSADVLAPYKGAKITGFRVGFGQDATGSANFWVRQGELTADDMTSTSTSVTKGWMDVKLPSAKQVTIPTDLSEPLYVGYTIPVKANKYVVYGSMYGGLKSGQMYVCPNADAANSQQQWEDAYNPSEPYPLLLFITVESESAGLQNLVYLNGTVYNHVGTEGTQGTQNLTITNAGTNAVRNIHLKLTQGEKSWESRVTLPESIKAGDTKKYTFQTMFHYLASGPVTMEISKVNNKENQAAETMRSITVNAIAVPADVAKNYTKRTLLEFIGSETDYNSARHFDNYMKPMLEKYGDKISFMTQHYSDKYSMNVDDRTGYDDCTRLQLDNALTTDAITVPAMCLDRTDQVGNPVRYANNVFFSILNPDFASSVFDEQLGRPTFASVNVKSDYDKANYTATVTVSGHIAEGVMPEGQQLQLNVYLVENDVESTSQELPDSEWTDVNYPDKKYTHPAIIRAMATPLYGEAVAEGDYSKTYTFRMESSTWNPEKMRVIAYLQRPQGEWGSETTPEQYNEMMRSRDVINCGEAVLTTETGLDPVKDEFSDDTPGDGVIFGYSPTDVQDESRTSFIGSNKNNSLEAVIRVSAAATPQFKGGKITAVRFNLRSDYAQQNSYSRLRVYKGGLDGTPLYSIARNFHAGWNTVALPAPLEIGSDDIYVGFQVFETQAEAPLPVVSYSNGCTAQSAYINVGKTGWQEQTLRAPYIQAVIETTADAAATPQAMSSIYDVPLRVAPNEKFAANLYVKNVSSTPITEMVLTHDNGTITLTKDIPAYGYAEFPVEILTGAQEASDVKLNYSITSINGQPVQNPFKGQTTLFVTSDNFIRVPVFEEFTSTMCQNCPYMSYWMDKAFEEYNKPYIYLTRHAGFVQDQFTQPVDVELDQIFGVSNYGNPSLIIDRKKMDGQKSIVLGTGEMGYWTNTYIEMLESSAASPAYASVNVKANAALTEAEVSGRVTLGSMTSDGNVRLSAYLVEDFVESSATKNPQMGVHVSPIEGAPDELFQTYSHNGIVRAVLTKEQMGDAFTFDAKGNYSAKFEIPALEADWNAANCHVVALVHRYNKADASDNYILNAGDSHFRHLNSSIEDVTLNYDSELQVRLTADRRIEILSDVASPRLYDMAGRQMDLNMPQLPGIYVLSAITPSGRPATLKLAIR